MLAFITQSWLNSSLRSNDAKAIFKKNGFLTENFYCKCFIVFFHFLCWRRSLDIGPKYSNRFSWEKSPHYSLFCCCMERQCGLRHYLRIQGLIWPLLFFKKLLSDFFKINLIKWRLWIGFKEFNFWYCSLLACECSNLKKLII